MLSLNSLGVIIVAYGGIWGASRQPAVGLSSLNAAATPVKLGKILVSSFRARRTSSATSSSERGAVTSDPTVKSLW